MSDDLVERVAREFCTVDGADPCEVVCGLCLHRARLVVAVVLEEAAKVCDGIEDRLTEQWKANYKVCDYTQGASDGANDCATAIRR